ncbi:MAG TPA: hypothetical protein G4N92_09235 [Anaerolineae bacterium]|nr:hypothetical protein [Anaerolineae bacterium]
MKKRLEMGVCPRQIANILGSREGEHSKNDTPGDHRGYQTGIMGDQSQNGVDAKQEGEENSCGLDCLHVKRR